MHVAGSLSAPGCPWMPLDDGACLLLNTLESSVGVFALSMQVLGQAGDEIQEPVAMDLVTD